MAGASNARAGTEMTRLLAALAFGIGASVGGYAIYGKGGAFIKSATHMAATKSTTAKFVSIDETADPALHEGIGPEHHGKLIGTYIYYMPDRSRVEVKGFLPAQFDTFAPRPGTTFDLTYSGNPPSKFWFRKKDHPAMLLPSLLELLILFWMVSAGVTGVYVNMIDDEDEREDGYGDGAQYGGAVTRTPQAYGGQASGGVPGQFGRR